MPVLAQALGWLEGSDVCTRLPTSCMQQHIDEKQQQINELHRQINEIQQQTQERKQPTKKNWRGK